MMSWISSNDVSMEVGLQYLAQARTRQDRLRALRLAPIMAVIEGADRKRLENCRDWSGEGCPFAVGAASSARGLATDEDYKIGRELAQRDLARAK